MKKTYTFDLNTNSTKNNNFNNKSTNYSKILDDLIHADIMEKNYYLNPGYTSGSTGDIYLDKMIGINKSNNISIGLKDADVFTKAINFLAGYNIKGENKKLPYEYGKTYTLSDGTPIIFFDDSIQIGFDLYYFKDFNKPTFISSLSNSIKNSILDIYINGLKISIIK